MSPLQRRFGTLVAVLVLAYPNAPVAQSRKGLEADFEENPGDLNEATDPERAATGEQSVGGLGSGMAPAGETGEATIEEPADHATALPATGLPLASPGLGEVEPPKPPPAGLFPSDESAGDPIVPLVEDPVDLWPADLADLATAQMDEAGLIEGQLFEEPPSSAEDAEAGRTAASSLLPQDVFAPLPDGFDRPSLGTRGGPLQLSDLLDGWAFGLASSMYYDSNARRGSGGPLTPVEDDIVFSLAPSISYRTLGDEWFFAASGSFGWNHYFQTNPSDGYNIGANCQFGYHGAKIDLSASLGYSFDEGYNRYYGNAFTTQHQLSLGLAAAYRLSAKTSATMSVNTSSILPSGTFNGDSRSYGTSFGVRWRASPLLDLDGGFGYTLQSGDLQGDRQTFGPYLGASYRLAKKVSLNGRVSFDYVDYGGGGGSDFFLPMRLSLAYRASELWSADLSIYRDETANGGLGGGYRQTQGVRVGYNRRIRRARLTLGASFEENETSNAASTRNVPGTSGEYFDFDAAISMPVFENRADASFFIRYTNDQGTSQRNWDGYQIGVQLSVAF